MADLKRAKQYHKDIGEGEFYHGKRMPERHTYLTRDFSFAVGKC